MVRPMKLQSMEETIEIGTAGLTHIDYIVIRIEDIDSSLVSEFHWSRGAGSTGGTK